MLFNSIEFAIFLPLVLMLYHALGHRAQNRLLLVASYLFYGWWDWRFLGLLVASTVVDYFCARAIEDRRSAGASTRPLVTLSVATNIGILGFFKYFDFFAASTARALEAFGLGASMPVLELILPVGISFYTFQTMAYTIDVYRGHATAERDFGNFALYVSFFPQLVAGPIERARTLLPQIQRDRRVDGRDVRAGLDLILIGLFKKMCIADGVAPHVDRAFADPSALSAPELVLCGYLFAIQIYGDFSGYTDVARGSARLLGIRLSANFLQPYLSASIAEFWRRWHVSLSSWLRDYLYIPLGGNRRGPGRTYSNLFATMLLGGLWHGASWHFVVWGGAHGAALAAHRLTTGRSVSGAARHRASTMRWARVTGTVATFHLVTLLWIFFRADDLAGAVAYLEACAGPWSWPPARFLVVAGMSLGAVWLLDLAARRCGSDFPLREDAPAWQRGLLYAGLLSALSFVGDSGVRPFIYFQF